MTFSGTNAPKIAGHLFLFYDMVKPCCMAIVNELRLIVKASVCKIFLSNNETAYSSFLNNDY